MSFREQNSFAQFIPYSSLIADEIVYTREGDMLAIFKIEGIAFESTDNQDLQYYLESINTLFRALSSHKISFYRYLVRRRINKTLHSTFNTEFLTEIDRLYYEKINQNIMLDNELYFTVIFRPDYPRKSSSIDEKKEAIIEKIKQFRDVLKQIHANFDKYGCRVLTTYTDDTGRYSETLEFLNFLLSGFWHKVKAPNCPLHEYLGDSWLFFGNEIIEMKSHRGNRYVRMIEIKDYVNSTTFGMFDVLMYSKFEFVLAQSFAVMNTTDGKDFIKKQLNQLKSAEDDSITQVFQLQEAVDDLASGMYSMGGYHFGLAIYGSSPEEVTKFNNELSTDLNDLGFLVVNANRALQSGFFAQLPANFALRPRLATITSRNYAGMISFHTFPSGKLHLNPWGDAVTLLKSPSNQPFAFNFHAPSLSELNKDLTGQKPLANTCVIGQSGSGKTVLLTFMLNQLQKYSANAPMGFTTVFFDKDRGAEINIKALGGRYLAIEKGKPTGFNPLYLDPTSENVIFLINLIKLLISPKGKLSIIDDQKIEHAVTSAFSLERKYRNHCISRILENLTEGLSKEEKENSVFRKLLPWSKKNNGVYAWVFDNEHDELSFEGCENFGIDGTEFLDDKETCAPIAFYLLHRVEQMIDGRHFVYFMDEFWKWLADPVFSDFAKNKQKTIRKQDGFGVFATQSPSDVLNSDVARAIIEQSGTFIFLPNPKAEEDEYINGFKLSHKEYNLIKKLDEKSRMFLVKQGFQSTICELDLSCIGKYMKVLSGSTDNVAILDSIEQEFGNDPVVWLPEFLKRAL